MLKASRKFFAMDSSMRRLLLEALLYLAWARILKAMPFARIAPSLGERMHETSMRRNPEQEALLIKIARALHMAGRHTLWESKCLVMAIACLKMLERRGIESTLYMGVARDPSGNMIAHAWLRSGVLYLTGAEELGRYAVVATFGKSFPDQAIQRRPANG